MSEEKKEQLTEKPVDLSPNTIEARENAPHIEMIAEEGDEGGKIAADLEKDYEEQDLLYNSADAAKEAKEAALDEMEKASQKALEAMRAEGGEKGAKIVDEAEEELDDAFADFRKWLHENTDPEKVKAEMDRLGKDAAKILKSTRDSVKKTIDSEQFQSTMKAGQDFVKGTGNMIGEGLKYGYDKAMEVPEIKKVAAHVDEGVDKIRQSDFLKDIVNGTEKGITDFNNFIFGGLHSFFDDKSASKKDDDKKAD